MMYPERWTLVLNRPGVTRLRLMPSSCSPGRTSKREAFPIPCSRTMRRSTLSMIVSADVRTAICDDDRDGPLYSAVVHALASSEATAASIHAAPPTRRIYQQFKRIGCVAARASG
jgi:hypothetical protein